MGRRLSHRQQAILFSLRYLEGGEYERGASIPYTRLKASFDKTIWRYVESIDTALIVLELVRLVKISRSPSNIACIQLTEAGRRIADRIPPLAAVFLTGQGLVNRPY